MAAPATGAERPRQPGIPRQRLMAAVEHVAAVLHKTATGGISERLSYYISEIRFEVSSASLTSNMSGLEIFAAFEASFGLLHDIIKLCREVQRNSKFPKELRLIEETLDRIQRQVRAASEQLQKSDVHENAEDIKAIGHVCQRDCSTLKKLFEKYAADEEANTIDRILAHAKIAFGKLRQETQRILCAIHENLDMLLHYQVISNGAELDTIRTLIREIGNRDVSTGANFNNFGGGNSSMNDNRGATRVIQMYGGNYREESTNVYLGDQQASNFTINAFRPPAHATQGYKPWYEKHKDVNCSPTKGTCEWFREHANFVSWFENTGEELLWISADPGCGKSVIAKALIDEGQRREDTVLYFFFKDNSNEQDTPNLALRAMLHQLFSLHPVLFQDYAVTQRQLFGDALVEDDEALWRLFLNAARDTRAGRVVCIIDALDECIHKGQEWIVQRLADFYHNRKPRSSLKFLITSRPYKNINYEFGQITRIFPSIHLSGESEHEKEKIAKEILIVIREEIERIGNLHGIRQEVLEEAVKLLSEKRNLTFLWLTFVIDEIREAVPGTSDALIAVVNDLPRTVEGAYEKILSRSKHPTKARNILSIVLAAKSPLTLDDLDVCLTVQEHDAIFQSHKALNTKRRMRDYINKNIREWCGLFLNIVHDRIYLIHLTAKEFLEAQKGVVRDTDLAWKHSIRPTLADQTLGIICLKYLLIAQTYKGQVITERSGDALFRQSYWPERGDPRVRFRDFLDSDRPFATYAVDNWAAHVRDAERENSGNMIEHAMQLYQMPEGNAWLLAYRDSFPVRPGRVGRQNPGNMGKIVLFYFMCYYGHIELVQRTMTSFTPKQRLKGFSWARQGGHNPTIQYLEPFVHFTGSKDREMELLWAIDHGHLKLVQFYLETGVDINRAHGRRLPPLYVAIESHAFSPQSALIELLLENGADVDLEHGKHGSPLNFALKKESEDSVICIVKHYINRKNSKVRPPDHLKDLFCSSRFGATSLKLLLDLAELQSHDWSPLLVTGFRHRLAHYYYFNQSSLEKVAVFAERYPHLIDDGVLSTAFKHIGSNELRNLLTVCKMVGEDGVAKPRLLEFLNNVKSAGKDDVVDKCIRSGVRLATGGDDVTA